MLMTDGNVGLEQVDPGKFQVAFRTGHHLHGLRTTGIALPCTLERLLAQHGIDFVEAVGHRDGLELGVPHVTGQVLLVIAWMLEASVTMLALVLVLVNGGFVSTVNSVGHG